VVTNAPSHLSDRLLAYWKFDDGLTNAFATGVTDSRGTNAGTLVRNDGASHWFDSSIGKLGGCLKLEGANAYVTLPASGGLDINTNALSFSAWIWLPTLPSQLATSYGPIYDSTTDCYVLYLDKANKELRFKVTDVNGHAARPGIPEAYLQTNQWLHIAATYLGSDLPTAGRATIYLNGQPYDTHTGSDSSTPTGLTGNVKTGQAAAMGREGPTGANYFTGMVDDVALWKRALTAEEVANLYTAGLAGQSLGTLLALPSPLIELYSVHLTQDREGVEIFFRNRGPWQTFKLVRADSSGGPFQVVEGVNPVALGGGEYRVVCPLSRNPSGYFRIRAE